MPTYNQIVVAENPRGRFKEGELGTATAKPGQCVKLSSVSGVNTDLLADGVTVRNYTLAPGFAGEHCILRENALLGKTTDDAYAVGDNIFYYIPLPGDEFVALGLSGQTLNVGTRASFNAAGKLIADVDGDVVCLDAGGALAADTLLMVRLGASSTATAA